MTGHGGHTPCAKVFQKSRRPPQNKKKHREPPDSRGVGGKCWRANEAKRISGGGKKSDRVTYTRMKKTQGTILSKNTANHAAGGNTNGRRTQNKIQGEKGSMAGSEINRKKGTCGSSQL